MVVLADEVKLADDAGLRLSRTPTKAILVLVAIFLGYLGWVLPSPGGSLVVPTLIVFGIGIAVGIADWVITGSRATTIAVNAAGGANNRVDERSPGGSWHSAPPDHVRVLESPRNRGLGHPQ